MEEIVMRKTWKRNLTLFMTASLLVGSIAGCGTKKNATNTGSNSKAEATPTESNTQGSDTEQTAEADERYIDDGGLTWDTQENMYVMEEEILNGSKQLKLWIDNEKFGEAVKEGFTKLYPNIDMVVEVVASTDSVSKMALEGEAGTGADVFMIPHDGVGEAMNSAVIGMMGKYTSQIDERFLSSAVDTIEFDGMAYGVPFLTESISLIYNKTLLQEMYDQGIVDTAEPITDFMDLIDIAAKYNDPANNKWTIRWETGNSYVNFMWLTSAGYQLFGANHDDPDQVNLNSQEVINGLTTYSKLRESWNVNSGDTTWDSTVIEFAKGETPYVVSGPWAMETIAEGAKENGYEYGVTKLPTINGQQPYTFSGVQLACVSSYSKYPGAARALAMYLGSDEILSFLYSELGKLPAVNDGSTIPGLSEDANVQAFMAQAEYSFAMPAIPEMSYYWTATESMFRGVWDGTMTPEQAAEKAQVDYEALRVSGQ